MPNRHAATSVRPDDQPQWRPARSDPWRRVRRPRRGPQARQGRRGRRAGRQPRLPHVPADAVPGGHRPARRRRGRPPAARPVPRPAERRGSHGHGDLARPRKRRGRSSTTWLRSSSITSSWGLVRKSNFFGVEGAEEHAFPMYTLADAVRLKEHVLRRWEAADRDPSLADDGALAIVVVGGGPTGVESVGALWELYRSDFAKDYPSMPADRATLTLVEAGPALFSMFDQELQTYAPDTLAAWGVEVLLSEQVTRRSPDPGDAQVRARIEGAHAGLGRRAARASDSGVDRDRAGARGANPRRLGARDRRVPERLCGWRHRLDHRRP